MVKEEVFVVVLGLMKEVTLIDILVLTATETAVIDNLIVLLLTKEQVDVTVLEHVLLLPKLTSEGTITMT